MRSSSVLVAAATLAALIAPAAAGRAGTAELLSLQGVTLKPQHYIDGFKIETLGVRILAVCHIPMGWHLTAGGGIDLFGELSGESQGGVANIRSDRLTDLKSMFLVIIEDDPPAVVHFRGTINVGAYKRSDLKLALRPENIATTPATSCPPQ